MSTNYNFDRTLKISEAKSMLIEALLKNYFQAETVRRNLSDSDDGGIDYFVFRGKETIFVDAKVREIEFPGDIALEVWSNKEAKHLGWTLDSTKQTDYYIFLWKDKYILYPARPLREIFRENYKEWKNKYRSAIQTTNHLYSSECIFIPVSEIDQKISEKIKDY